MEIVTNQERAIRLFARLIADHRSGEFPYTAENMAKLPQAQVGKELWNNANFWFYLCHLMRGMIKSDYAASQVVQLYHLTPELFDPAQAVKMTEEEINEQLKRVFKLSDAVLRWQRYGQAWRRNSEILLAWGGNILDVYRGCRTEADIRARVMNKLKYGLPLKEQGFYTFQEKMCSLLTYFLMVAGLISTIRTSPPIDFHHMRVMVGTGMIDLPEGSYRPKLVAAAGDRIGRDYLDRFRRMEPVKFADLLFVLSREGCARAVTEADADWDDSAVIGRYQRSCGRCPLEDECHRTVVTDDYYIRDGRSRVRVIQVISRPKPSRPSRLG
jgi:hypothetical protein